MNSILRNEYFQLGTISGITNYAISSLNNKPNVSVLEASLFCLVQTVFSRAITDICLPNETSKPKLIGANVSFILLSSGIAGLVLKKLTWESNLQAGLVSSFITTITILRSSKEEPVKTELKDQPPVTSIPNPAPIPLPHVVPNQNIIPEKVEQKVEKSASVKFSMEEDSVFPTEKAASIASTLVHNLKIFFAKSEDNDVKRVSFEEIEFSTKGQLISYVQIKINLFDEKGQIKGVNANKLIFTKCKFIIDKIVMFYNGSFIEGVNFCVNDLSVLPSFGGYIIVNPDMSDVNK
jgi:hypothetical protein